MPSYLLKFKQQYSVEIGGRRYPVVKIGNQFWMAENLDFIAEGITFRDGTSGNTWTKNTGTSEASYYNYDPSTYGWTGKKYGLLYSWSAANSLTIPGWHLPSLSEWNELIEYIGSGEGTKLKSTTDWSSGNGTDDYGFAAFPSGMYTGSFKGAGTQTPFWTSSKAGAKRYYKYLAYNSTTLDESKYNDYYGCAVRLVRDT